MSTILAIDYGIKRVGLALSPDQMSLVLPFGCIVREDGSDEWIEQILQKIKEASPDVVVIGLPFDMEGQETDMTRRIREFGDLLSTRMSVPISYVDERFSTAQGKRSEGGVGDDEKAAMVILEGYLEKSS